MRVSDAGRKVHEPFDAVGAWIEQACGIMTAAHVQIDGGEASIIDGTIRREMVPPDLRAVTPEVTLTIRLATKDGQVRRLQIEDTKIAADEIIPGEEAMALITAKDAEAAQEVHRAADNFNKALANAHRMRLRITLNHEPQGEDVRLPNYGSDPFVTPGEPPSVSVEVARPLPAKEKPG